MDSSLLFSSLGGDTDDVVLLTEIGFWCALYAVKEAKRDALALQNLFSADLFSFKNFAVSLEAPSLKAAILLRPAASWGKEKWWRA